MLADNNDLKKQVSAENDQYHQLQQETDQKIREKDARLQQLEKARVFRLLVALYSSLAALLLLILFLILSAMTSQWVFHAHI